MSKKAVIAGAIVGAVLSISVLAGASTYSTTVNYKLQVYNPIWGAPYARAHTTGNAYEYAKAFAYVNNVQQDWGAREKWGDGEVQSYDASAVQYFSKGVSFKGKHITYTKKANKKTYSSSYYF